MLIISHLKKYFFNSALILRVVIGITIIIIGAVIFYNQMLSIAEKKTVSNYNLLQGCIKETPHEQEEEKCFKKYPIDLRFVDLTIHDSEGNIVRKYYAGVDRQPENSLIQEWMSPVLNFLVFFVLFIFVSVLFSFFAISILRSSATRSQAKRENIITDQEEEDDCQCDDCLQEKSKEKKVL